MIREFEWKDIDQVLEIENASFPLDSWNREDFMKWYERCRDGFLVATDESNTKVLGYSITEIVGPGVGYLRSIAVRKTERKKGIGKRLIDETIKRLKIRELYLHVRVSNEEAIKFYERIGFVKEKIFKGVYHDGEDAVYMKLKIDNRKNRE